MWRIKIKKEPRRQVKVHVFLPPPSPVLANIHSILAYDVPRTKDVGLTTKYRFNVRPALQPIAGSMPDNRLRRWPNTKPSLGLLYTLQHTNAVLMLTHSLRRWTDIETELGDCSVFWLRHCYGVTLYISAPETPDNMIHWPNADVMLGPRLRHWANIIPTKNI